MATDTMPRMGQTGSSSEAQQHSEGTVARAIEEQTAKLPSDIFLWAAGASILGSLALQFSGNKHEALFVGQWAPTFLLLGVYNKLVKSAGPTGRRLEQNQTRPSAVCGRSQHQCGCREETPPRQPLFLNRRAVIYTSSQTLPGPVPM